MLESSQIFLNINLGLVVLGQDLRVQAWNRWLEHHSGHLQEVILGKNLLDFYPDLREAKYQRFMMSVFSFGNYAYFSQKLHRYLFPMKNPHSSANLIPLMQQSCTAGPIRDEKGLIQKIFITVEDVTEVVANEIRLKERLQQLQKALDKVKQLEGIIPICMYCKRIRNDVETWQQLEQYISQHSEAQFSHGICPECVKKMPWMEL